MSWNDTLAMQALVSQVPILAGRVYVTTAPAPPTGGTLPLPYAVIHPADGKDEQTRFTGPYSTEHPEFTIHSVGSTANQAKVVADLIKAQIIVNGFGVIPVVAGRKNQPAYYRSPIPVQIDADVTPPLCFHVAEVGWTSDPQ